jgi:hypothetical protein
MMVLVWISPERLKEAVEGIEAAAYRTVRQGEALCQEIRCGASVRDEGGG